MNQGIEQFKRSGVLEINELLDKDKCASIYKKILNDRNWGEQLFRSESEVISSPQLTKTNPGKGVFNLAEKFDLSFIENNQTIRNYLNLILGKNYYIKLKKITIAACDDWIPKWLKDKVSKTPHLNLGPYIKEQYRNVSYFRGIDFHQDLTDLPDTNVDFITMYVYLNDIDATMSPLTAIESSHIYGCTRVPHYLKEDKDDNYIYYGIDENNCKRLKKKHLLGKMGSVYIWTGCTLHGATPSKINNDFRIALRYTIKKQNSEKSIIDKMTGQFFTGKEGELRDDIDQETKEYLNLKTKKILK